MFLIEKVFPFSAQTFPLVMIHPDLLDLVDGDYCAASLLYILLSWHAWKSKKAAPSSETWIFMSLDDFERALGKQVNEQGQVVRKPLFARDSIVAALNTLLIAGKHFLRKRHNQSNAFDRTFEYAINFDILREARKHLNQIAVQTPSLEELPEAQHTQEISSMKQGKKQPCILEKSSAHGRKTTAAITEKPTMHDRKAADESSDSSITILFSDSEPSSSLQKDAKHDDESGTDAPFQGEGQAIYLQEEQPPQMQEKDLSQLCFLAVRSLEAMKRLKAESPLPPMPPETMAWCPEKLLWWMQSKHGGWYTPRVERAELQAAQEYFALPWPDGKTPTQEETDEIYTFISSWWTSSGRVEMRNLVKSELAVRVQAQIRKRKQQEAISQGEKAKQQPWNRAKQRYLRPSHNPALPQYMDHSYDPASYFKPGELRLDIAALGVKMF